MTEFGIKNDGHKPPIATVSPMFISEMAHVLQIGDDKYGRLNWLKGLDYERLVSAHLRHIYAFMSGEKNDAETGISHLISAACCLMMLHHYEETGRTDLDNRRFK